ncbi:hypothetical protein DFJ73DRAFT_781708 [Zopfochytrium polystomum]|nr:hypothetical protein DFJ73DRAFT_781708 [Zopfochytrium polystomum]
MPTKLPRPPAPSPPPPPPTADAIDQPGQPPTGIVFTGAGIRGAVYVYSVLASRLLETVSVAWTLQCVALLSLLVNALAVAKKTQRSAFKDRRFALLVGCSSIALFLLFMPPLFLLLYAGSVGLSLAVSSVIFAGPYNVCHRFNLASAIGLLGFGLFADSLLGNLNTLVVCLMQAQGLEVGDCNGSHQMILLAEDTAAIMKLICKYEYSVEDINEMLAEVADGALEIVSTVEAVKDGLGKLNDKVNEILTGTRFSEATAPPPRLLDWPSPPAHTMPRRRSTVATKATATALVVAMLLASTAHAAAVVTATTPNRMSSNVGVLLRTEAGWKLHRRGGAIKKAVHAVENVAKDVGNGVANVAKDVAHGVADVAKDVAAKGVATAAKDTAKAVAKVAPKVLKVVENATPVTRAITGVVKTTITAVKDIKDGKSIKTIAKDIGKALWTRRKRPLQTNLQTIASLTPVGKPIAAGLTAVEAGITVAKGIAKGESAARVLKDAGRTVAEGAAGLVVPGGSALKGAITAARGAKEAVQAAKGAVQAAKEASWLVAAAPPQDIDMIAKEGGMEDVLDGRKVAVCLAGTWPTVHPPIKDCGVAVLGSKMEGILVEADRAAAAVTTGPGSRTASYRLQQRREPRVNRASMDPIGSVAELKRKFRRSTRPRREAFCMEAESGIEGVRLFVWGILQPT